MFILKSSGQIQWDFVYFCTEKGEPFRRFFLYYFLLGLEKALLSEGE